MIKQGQGQQKIRKDREPQNYTVNVCKHVFLGYYSLMLAQNPKKVRVKRGISGLGLFADEKIKKGEYVISYKGKLISNEEAEKLKTRYLFELDDKYTIDGSSRENLARYINHFCEPNLEADIVAGEIVFIALKDIEKGEELGFDYGEEYFNDFIKKKGCACDAKIHKY